MKPISIVFLVIAVLLILGGLFVCSLAKDTAETDGYVLFRESDAGESYVRQDISEEISKVELVFADAKVRIVGGEETSYLEFFNFREGLYTLSAAGKIITFDEMPNIDSLLSFQGGLSFSGVRYLLRDGLRRQAERQIVVHLSPEAALKVLSLSCDSCEVTAQKVVTQFDLNVKASKNVTLDLKEYRTACAVSAEAPTVEFTAVDGYVNGITTDAGKLRVDASNLYIGTTDIKAESGTIRFLIPTSITPYGLDLETSGKLRVLGEAQDSPYRKEPFSERFSTLRIHGGSADIEIEELID